MKTLVIHPKDVTTDFLSVIYAGKDWTIINDPVASKKVLKEQIKVHDRIIMLGHGTEFGLGAVLSRKNRVLDLFFRILIDSSLVYLLKEKECVCIWCNADKFVEKYHLKGFYTGMIISEVEEAYHYSVNASTEEIAQSNVLFADSVKNSIDSQNILNEVKTSYDSKTNPVIYFNKQNLYHSEDEENKRNKNQDLW